MLGLATLARVWPLVIVPALFLRRLRAALVTCVAVIVAGSLWWTGTTSVDAVRQVATFRGATGWEVESPIGTAVWILTGDAVRMESGSPRVGSMPGWTRPALFTALVLVLAMIWRRSGRSDTEVLGRSALSAVAALLTSTPLFSLQYASWLLPFAAIANQRDEVGPHARLAFGAIALTGAIGWFATERWLGAAQSLLVVRAVVIGALVAVGLRRSRGERDPGQLVQGGVR
jgi:hypothetical protein